MLLANQDFENSRRNPRAWLNVIEEIWTKKWKNEEENLVERDLSCEWEKDVDRLRVSGLEKTVNGMKI